MLSLLSRSFSSPLPPTAPSPVLLRLLIPVGVLTPGTVRPAGGSVDVDVEADTLEDVVLLLLDAVPGGACSGGFVTCDGVVSSVVVVMDGIVVVLVAVMSVVVARSDTQ